MLALALRVCTVYIVLECEHITIFFRSSNGYAVFLLECVCVCLCRPETSISLQIEDTFISVSSTAFSAKCPTVMSVTPPLLFFYV